MDQHSDSIHQKFHSIINLTMLVSAINNNPEGRAHLKFSRLSSLLTPVDKDKPKIDLVLDCIANLLV